MDRNAPKRAEREAGKHTTTSADRRRESRRTRDRAEQSRRASTTTTTASRAEQESRAEPPQKIPRRRSEPRRASAGRAEPRRWSNHTTTSASRSARADGEQGRKRTEPQTIPEAGDGQPRRALVLILNYHAAPSRESSEQVEQSRAAFPLYFSAAKIPPAGGQNTKSRRNSFNIKLKKCEFQFFLTPWVFVRVSRKIEKWGI